MRTRTLAFPLLGKLNHTSQAVWASESHFSVFFRKGKRAGEGGGKDKRERDRGSDGGSLELLGLDRGGGGVCSSELSPGPKWGLVSPLTSCPGLW